MFRIRRIYDPVLPGNQDAIRQVKGILRAQFSGLTEVEIDAVGEHLQNPFMRRFRTILYVAENPPRRVVGFAYVLHEPKIGFCYLEYIASAKGQVSRGIGSALYEVVRQEARALGALGLFYECLPDDPRECPDAAVLSQNRARLRFYEQYGARPIVNTGYETPINPGDTGMPHLVFDGLNAHAVLPRDYARKVVRAILVRKYGEICPPQYVRKVVGSIKDDPVQLRAFRYIKPERQAPPPPARRLLEPIALVVNDRHDIHHIAERGYVEAPVRIPRILAELVGTQLFERLRPREFGMHHIKAVHDGDFVEYLRRACSLATERKSVYPYVFPIRNAARPPKELSVRAGYYCIDTFTPINRNAFPAAKRAVDCTLTAAETILNGARLAYALVRPPGHHAERRAFGGFCYFNNNAIAAHFFSRHGKVAIVDIDYHHGNGQENIFYERNDVLTVSIHGHPRFAYPYFTGFEDERGVGAGDGFNLNLPQPEQVDGAQYRKVLARALRTVQDFAPTFLVVALGLDTAKADPTGTWTLGAQDFQANGRMIGELGLPTLVVQEGGYRTRTLGVNARHFFQGLAQAGGGDRS